MFVCLFVSKCRKQGGVKYVMLLPNLFDTWFCNTPKFLSPSFVFHFCLVFLFLEFIWFYCFLKVLFSSNLNVHTAPTILTFPCLHPYMEISTRWTVFLPYEHWRNQVSHSIIKYALQKVMEYEELLSLQLKHFLGNFLTLTPIHLLTVFSSASSSWSTLLGF